MSTSTFKPIEARRAPVNTEGLVPWIRSNLFGDLRTTLATLLFGGVLVWYLPQLIDWAILRATWLADSGACRAEGANIRPGGRDRAGHSEHRVNTRGTNAAEYSGIRPNKVEYVSSRTLVGVQEYVFRF